MHTEDQGCFGAPFEVKRKLARAIVANSTNLIADEPVLMDLFNKLTLREKLGFTAKEVDEMPSDKVETYLFLIDTLNKKQKLVLR